MNDYRISEIYPTEKERNQLVDALLQTEGINRDKNLDYTCGVFDTNDELVGTGSCFGNTLRCLAIRDDHQGEGLMNTLVSHLISVQFQRGNTHLFVYTKVKSAPFFKDLGFTAIAQVADKLVFLENEAAGFSNYLDQLEKPQQTAGKITSIVVNANPFSLGHQYLIEKASAENDLVHLFIVSEDASLIPFAVRKQLVEQGTAHLDNIVYHTTGPYIISNSTFPSYFLKDDDTVIRTQAALDIELFIKIAQRLDLTSRYVGEEPYSQVTRIYNEIMVEKLAQVGITCHVIPRRQVADEVISASKIRLALKEDNLATVKRMVPQSTYDFFQTVAGKAIIAKIKQSTQIVHY
ncbi:[citrate (pro-3S)-lyase] ligase [Loigolactobacillus zhaoyuanensis]|uniref:[citrate (pro-3S)-lyase] ligase n=1 Tax=Loigolactobacillus zhaoyuanensis TaxID=2486017 RepID=UPI000F746130|nr:[citrate (pro-3S)-lyase] ligase [Loigolactobacillus zhaoyuanensis]